MGAVYSYSEVRLAMKEAAAIIMISGHADEPRLVNAVCDFILAAVQYQLSPDEENHTRMLKRAREPVIRAAHYGEGLL